MAQNVAAPDSPESTHNDVRAGDGNGVGEPMPIYNL